MQLGRRSRPRRQVEAGQQRPQAGNLAGSAVDLGLGEYGAGGVVHGGQQMDLAAVAGMAGAAQGLAVDGDRPSLPPPLLLPVAVG